MSRVSEYQDREGGMVKDALMEQLVSHLRLDEIATLIAATGKCQECHHLYLFHDDEMYKACQVIGCDCRG